MKIANQFVESNKDNNSVATREECDTLVLLLQREGDIGLDDANSIAAHAKHLAIGGSDIYEFDGGLVEIKRKEHGFKFSIK